MKIAKISKVRHEMQM